MPAVPSSSPALCSLSPDYPVWNQQRDEPASWYVRFEIYINLPTLERSQLEAYRRAQQAKNSTKKYRAVPPGWRRAFAFWRWRERAIAHDLHLRREQQIRRREWLDSLEEQEWQMAQKLFERAEEMLAYPLVTQTTSDDGQTIVIQPCKWSAKDIPRFLRLASDMGRLATGALQDIEPLQAIQILVEVGWLPNSVYDAAEAGIIALETTIRDSLQQNLNHWDGPS